MADYIFKRVAVAVSAILNWGQEGSGGGGPGSDAVLITGTDILLLNATDQVII